MRLRAQASSPRSSTISMGREEHPGQTAKGLSSPGQSRDATDPQAQEASLNAHCWFPWRLWGVYLHSELLLVAT